MTGVIALSWQSARRTRLVPLVAVLAIAALSGCQAPPTAEQVKTDVARALAIAAPAGLLSSNAVMISDISRVSGGRTVQFSADLRMERDHAFGSWDQLGIGSVARALGAAPWEVDGLKTEGNAAGDVLHVSGRALYRANDGGGWRLDHFGPPPPPIPPPRPRLRDDAWEVFRALIAVPQNWHTIRDNFAWAFARSHAQLARARGGFAIVSGPPGSDAWTVVEALRREATPERPVVNLVPRDSDEMTRFVRDGGATAAIIDSDQASALAETVPDLRALAALYPKQVHVVVAAGSKIASIVELRGKKIVIADPLSSAASAALNVYRLSATTTALTRAPLSAALASLKAGTADAVITVARAPEDHIAQAAAEQSIRLLGLDSDAIALLTTGENRYLAINIPARAYPNQLNAISTVAVVATLVAQVSVPEGEITTLLGRMFGAVDYVGSHSMAGTLIARDVAQRGLTLPLHPAAKSFFAASVIDR